MSRGGARDAPCETEAVSPGASKGTLMSLPSHVETVVVGAGQAGLGMSYFLRAADREHIVLDRRSTLGGGWQDRWDAFGLVTPNWTASFPGKPYDGAEPDGFMPRDEIVRRVAAYGTAIDVPVRLETEVTRLGMHAGGGFRLETNDGSVDADSVVVATGGYHVPRVPPMAAALPKRVEQLHSHAYRRETSLPAGAVLVVGSGQSGVQIAEELHEAGREVYLSVGSAPRLPRRYRGRDIFAWFADLVRRGPALGVTMLTVETLPDPRLRFAANPHLSGHGGGHETNLREMAARGMNLVGRFERVDGERITVAPDLATNLARADAFFGQRIQPMIERYIAAAGMDAPTDDRIAYDFEPPVVAELDLAAAGITTVIWTTGYAMDYSWIDLPIFEADGLPRHRRGVTDVPGLYFLGLLWQYNQTSATLFGPLQDGPHLARAMGVPVREEDTVLVS